MALGVRRTGIRNSDGSAASQGAAQGDEWLYEPKLAGYRALLLKDRNQVQILSRNERDLTRMYPTVTAAGSRLNARQAVIDGEIEPHAAGAPGSRLAGR